MAYTNVISTLTVLCVILQTTWSQNLENFQANMTSTESTITIKWDIVDMQNDTQYLLKHHRTNGIFITDLFFHSPFPSSHIEHTIPNLYPGVNYSIYIFRNYNSSEGKIFQENINTIPLPPVNLEVAEAGATWLNLTWEEGFNSSQSSHDIVYTDLQNSGTRTVIGNGDTSFNVTGLKPGHRYSFSLKAVIGSKKSNLSESIAATTVPAAPSSLVVTAVNTTHLSATWQPGQDSLQDGYEIASSAEGKQENEVTTLCPLNPPCVFAPGHLPGQLFNIHIYATRHNRTSSPTTVQHNTRPQAVSNLHGTADVRSINVTWNGPDHSEINYFKVQVVNTQTATEQNFNVTKDSAVNGLYTFSESSLQGGVSHNVHVRSATLTEESIDHNELLVTIPEAPTGLKGTAINTTAISLTWTLPRFSHIDHILVMVTKPNQEMVNVTLDKEETQKTIVNLLPGEVYDVSVYILTKIVSSTPVSGMFRTKPNPPAIKSLVVTETGATVTLETTGDQVPDYFMASVDALAVTRNISLQSPTADFNGLQEGTRYVINVYSVSGDQNSQVITQTFYTKPRPPTAVNVTAYNSTSIDVTWQNPDKGTYDNFTLTLVQTDGASQPQTVTTDTLYQPFTDVGAGETYNITIVTNLGSEESLPVLKQVTTAPFPITHIWVSARGSTQVTISWDSPIGTSFDYFMYDSSNGGISLAEIPNDKNELVLKDLEPGADYSVTVYAVSRGIKDDLQSEGAHLNFTTFPHAQAKKQQLLRRSSDPTSVATLEKIEANTTGIHVNWTSPADHHSFDFFYLVINPREGPAPNVTRGVGDHTYWFTGLRPGQQYNISIVTVKESHGGPQPSYTFGVPTFILAATQPSSVLNLEVESAGDESVNVSWTTDVNSQQDHFIIEYTSNDVSRTEELQYIINENAYSLQIHQLLSGFTYNVTVTAVRVLPQYDTTGSVLEWKTGTTAPKPVISLTPAVEDTTITLTWSVVQGSQQDSFRVDFRPILRVQDAEFVQLSTTERTMSLPSLFPGEKYEINVYAISNTMISELTATSDVIAPLAPNDLSVVSDQTSDHSITLMWTYLSEETFVQKWLVSAFNGTSTLPAVDVLPNGKAQIDYMVDNLRPGARYNFEVFAQVEQAESSRVRVNSTVKPVLSIEWTESVQQTTNNSIAFTFSLPNREDIFNRVRFEIDNPSSPSQFRPRNNNTVVMFDSLMAGTLYNVVAVSEIDGIYSSPQTLQIRTMPNAFPVTLTSTANTVVISLGMISGNADKFILQCQMKGMSCWNNEYNSDIHTVNIENLEPFTNYTITVVTVAGEKQNPQTYHVMTKQAPPSQVRNVRATESGLRTVQVTWDQPQDLHGVLQRYMLQYSGHDPTINGPDHEGTKDIPANTQTTTLEELKAGFLYTIKVRAVTVDVGAPGQVQITIKTAAPVLKADFTKETATPRRTSTEGNTVGETFVKVTFPNAFSEDNGRIISYTVIVATDAKAKDNLNSVRLPSWNDAQKKAVPAYQAVKNCTDFFTKASTCGMASRRKRDANDVTYKVFTVGAESNCAEKDYCNGPLKPETEYFFKLRAYTNGGFTDTEFSQKIKTAATPSNAGGIVGGVIAALIIIAIIAAVLIFLRRRRPKRAHKYVGERTTVESSSMHKFSRPVKLAEFKDHVRRMSADSDFRYAEEYEDLKEVGRDQPTMAAELPVNRPKNRFTNILPYDHSRVKLLPTDDEEGSDYINANYVPGNISKREYIATQGPLPSTRDDFWRMLWEQNSRNIVMLTKCMEKGREFADGFIKEEEKSDHYWPNDSEPKFYGDLQVAILNETHLPDWTISEFKIQLGEQARQIRHFHYKAWPDFGVPRNPTSLIRFVRTVREKMFREGGPVITHCSAGVGRSGTFIVLDHSLQHIKENDQVDVYQIVYKLRKERVLMVQTEQQYKFIHECLLCVLEGREDEATYANVGHVNVAYDDDEGINVEQP